MPKLTTPDQMDLNYTDIESGRPIVMIHGWPLSGAAFADNAKVLVAAGYWVITYGRRGFGQSEKPHDGCDYDTLTADLDALLAGLDLHDAVLLGFSMSGGEVAHYLTTCGSERVGATILSGSICPALYIAKDNLDDTMPHEGFQELADTCTADHAGFVGQSCGWFYGNEQGLAVPKEIRQQAVKIARQSAPHAAVTAIPTWTENPREDCRHIDVPLLVIYGGGDQNVPLTEFSAQMSEYAQQTQLVVIKDGPHGINVSHADRWNTAILSFLAGS